MAASEPMGYEDLRGALSKVLTPSDVGILVSVWELFGFQGAAERLGLTEGRVRHRFFGSIKTLERAAERDPTLLPLRDVFLNLARIILSGGPEGGIPLCLSSGISSFTITSSRT